MSSTSPSLAPDPGAPQGPRAPATRAQAKATPGDTRAHNRSLVLAQLFHGGQASRADLARATGLTRVTVSTLVADLIAEGLLVELGPAQAGRVGKPATLVGMRLDVYDVIAVDLSDDTLLRGAVVDLSGRVRQRRTSPLSGRTGTAAVQALRDLCAELMAATSRRVLGIGIGSPGVVEGGGVVVQAPNLGWQDEALSDVLTEALGTPVWVANDANAAVLAEVTFGAAATGWVTVVTVGHGVGAGLVADRQLVRGAHAAAGELGHVTLDPEGSMCACGRRGCLETVLAAPALRRALTAAGTEGRSAVLQHAGQALGAVLAPVVSTLDLREVLLSGPPELLDGPLREAVQRTLADRTMPIIGSDLTVRMARLGEDGVLVGATALVISGQLGVS
ncbi:MAG TPA: ROK family transcriptional regulator [Ruania sp.]|nr:ROK family transcriptional regulator [Ruania sp.]